VTRVINGVLHRLLHVEGEPIVVRAWEQPWGDVTFRAEGIGREGASREQLELAIDRQRFALGIDEDMTGFYDAFKRDPVLGPVIHRRPHLRPRRTVWPWQALLRAITKQLIESGRAAEIERRIVRKWGIGAAGLLDVPDAARIKDVAPAELVSFDLTEARSLAMIRCAREVAAGRADLFDPASDRRLRAIPEIGPWTVQCVGLDGRGDADSLPAGDLGYIKLVGVLAGLGRRATVEEVEEYFAPYEPYRGMAGTFLLIGLHKAVGNQPPLKIAA
jgi:3-methyladenine DNA glycosylase/8-oxoguanine DNA glycosylase